MVQRMDDSVVRDSGEMLRRSRGYVPDAIALPPGFRDVPPILCLGADLKKHVLSGTRRTGGCQPTFGRSQR
ncbi:hydrogenase maturation protein [Salmonella enterica subsp. enterica serovar Heidelberg str. N18440]|nr:hydrogenase maturation protein [Salmonella enterica subsp. enterica serovar Heidelberg str. N18440]